MIVHIMRIIIELICLGLMIAAGGLWAGMTSGTRPKYDEQTLLGGTIWSQIIIPIGLLISTIVGEPLDIIVHGYYLLTGIVLMFITATELILNECKVLSIPEVSERVRQRALADSSNTSRTASKVSQEARIHRSKMDGASVNIGTAERSGTKKENDIETNEASTSNFNLSKAEPKKSGTETKNHTHKTNKTTKKKKSSSLKVVRSEPSRISELSTGSLSVKDYDSIHFGIGLLILIAAVMKLIEFITLILI